MLKRLAARPLVSVAVGGALALALGAFLLQDAAFRWVATPSGSFVRETAPPAPDYADAAAWALRPTIKPAGAWERPWGVDIFFVHPSTAYAGDAWNTPFDDPKAANRLEERILPVHSGDFAHAGPVYAPRYRQAALHAELDVGGQGDGAFDLAYQDVLRAFDDYLEADNQGRAVILAGVGQGGLHALRLLRERFQDDPLKERLAAVYLIETAAPEDLASIGVSQPLCDSPDSIHCVVVWRTQSAPGPRASAAPIWTTAGEIEPFGRGRSACVNPLLWRATEEFSPAADHRGALRATPGSDEEIEQQARMLATRCLNGLLDIDFAGSAAGYRPSGWGGRFKTPEYNLFYADIAFNASERARAAGVWLDDNARKPAKPLPPVVALPDTPIYRPDGVAEPVR